VLTRMNAGSLGATLVRPPPYRSNLSRAACIEIRGRIKRPNRKAAHHVHSRGYLLRPEAKATDTVVNAQKYEAILDSLGPYP
jgi:hypothetical protein